MRVAILNFLLILYISSSSVMTEEVATSSTTIKADNEISSSSSSSSTTIATTAAQIESEVTTAKNEENQSTISPEISSSSLTITMTTTDGNNSVDENSNESSEDNNSNESLIPLEPPSPSSQQKRKVLYINQQQSGKLNVHLELNDVSLIVIPNKKDPQLSLLNLLLRSAQKSNLKNNVEKKKENVKINIQHSHDDDYTSKYKMDNYVHASTVEPSIESRAPYRVDISSALSQHPVVEVNSGQSQGRSPLIKFINRMHKRSIDTNHFLEFNTEVLNDRSISENNSEEEQELINSIENNLNNFNEGEREVDSGTEFILLGAVENCGPGRKRNSYQICVAMDD